MPSGHRLTVAFVTKRDVGGAALIGEAGRPLQSPQLALQVVLDGTRRETALNQKQRSFVQTRHECVNSIKAQSSRLA